jgi:Ran GTPase-activating protein (RanGAP) involved in mRNA processing and transport
MGIWSGRDKTLDLLKYAEPIAGQRQPQLRFHLAGKEAKSVMERMTCKGNTFFYQHGEHTHTRSRGFHARLRLQQAKLRQNPIRGEGVDLSSLSSSLFPSPGCGG